MGERELRKMKRRRKGSGLVEVKHGGYKDLPHRLWLSAREEAGLMVMEGSQPSKKWAAAAETAEGLERNSRRVPLSETC